MFCRSRIRAACQKNRSDCTSLLRHQQKMPSSKVILGLSVLALGALATFHMSPALSALPTYALEIGEIHCGHWLWSALLGCLQNHQPLAISAAV